MVAYNQTNSSSRPSFDLQGHREYLCHPTTIYTCIQNRHTNLKPCFKEGKIFLTEVVGVQILWYAQTAQGEHRVLVLVHGLLEVYVKGGIAFPGGTWSCKHPFWAQHGLERETWAGSVPCAQGQLLV